MTNITRYHVVDTETVGLKPFDHGGGVCEISIREICPDTTDTLKEHYALINPEGPISATASGVHMISNARVENEPVMGEWLEQVGHPWHEDKEPFYFIAHNAAFDERFLKPYIGCNYKVVDTLLLARRHLPNVENHKMQTLRFELELDDLSDTEERFDAHSAAGDTQVLLLLIRYLIGITGMTLQELCEDAQVREPLTKMPFGKYRGRTFESIHKENPKYFEWCIKNFKDPDPELIAAMKEARGE